MPTSVYWYCARLTRVEIWMSCVAWKYTVMPGMPATASFSRAMMVSTCALRVIARLQGDGEPAGIGRGVERADADHRHHAGDVGVGADRVFDRALAALHFGEGDVGAGFGHRRDQAGVLQRQEALRHDDVEENGGGQRRQRHQQRLALVAQHPEQALVIGLDRALEQAVESGA